jgi:cytoplasmic iron level regulating protein YaaA (DUF328/UPF0246 family)
MSLSKLFIRSQFLHMYIAYTMLQFSSMLLYSAKGVRTFEDRMQKTLRKQPCSIKAAILAFLGKVFNKSRETSPRKAGDPTCVNNLETCIQIIIIKPRNGFL